MTDGLEGGFPSQSLQVLCEVVGSDEGEDMRLEAFEVGVVRIPMKPATIPI